MLGSTVKCQDNCGEIKWTNEDEKGRSQEEKASLEIVHFSEYIFVRVFKLVALI